jgi:hypothetical protein
MALKLNFNPLKASTKKKPKNKRLIITRIRLSIIKDPEKPK